MALAVESSQLEANRGDEDARRAAVKRAMDVILHLQSRLRSEIGGKPAQALGEFYVSIFAQILQASQAASRPKFLHVIGCVRTVRDAWRQAAEERLGLPEVLDHTIKPDSAASIPGMQSNA